MKVTKALRDATRRNFEALSGSKTFCLLFNDKMIDEVIPLIQMGLAVYLDKPIVILMPTGAVLPGNLRAMATAGGGIRSWGVEEHGCRGPAACPSGQDVTDRPDYRSHLRRRLYEHCVPRSLHAGLIEYFAARRPTGGFLQSVLENNLREAALRGDPVNAVYLAEIVAFLHNYVPSPAWGSPAAVEAWLADPAPAPEIFE